MYISLVAHCNGALWTLRQSNRADNFQETLEFVIAAVILPTVCEPTDHLKISILVVAAAINPIERAQKLRVVVATVKLQSDTGQRTEALLRLNESG
jgi:hypothetical protein